jgi:glycosyltransferase involved in cell wall biosynthesis
MKFSVIIPAHNESANLPTTLAALSAQTIPRNELEIIVVDNNSIDDTFMIAEKSGADLVIKEKEQGTNMARNAGLNQAQGEIVAFLDADCLPPADWLEKIAAYLADGRFAAVSGPFDYGFTGIKKLSATIYNNFLIPSVPRLLEMIFRRRAGVIIGGNFGARRGTLLAIGGIPPLAFWGDDVAIAMLISRRVGPVLFDPQLVVKSSPRRFEKNGMIKLVWRYVGSYFKIYFDKKFS